MYAQGEKPKENKSRAVANSVAQNKGNAKQGFGFVDNRSEAIVQRKLQEMDSLSVVQKCVIHAPRCQVQCKQKQAFSTETNLRHMSDHLQESQTSSNKTTQLKAIEKAGLELELKGTALLMEGDTETDEPEKIPNKYHVHEGDGWWIEIDSNYPELVTEPVDSEEELLEKLSKGKHILEWMQYFALVKGSEERTKIKEELVENGIVDWLVPDLGDGSAYIAKPQLSVQIGKGNMKEFADHVVSGKILHKKARVNKTDEVGYDNTQFDRIHGGVTVQIQKMRTDPIMKTSLANICGDETDSGGLALITIITMLHAARHHEMDNEYHYYKARFSVMPRTALSAMYDSLSEIQKLRYRTLVKKWVDDIYLYNDFAEHYEKVETRIQKHDKRMENENRVRFNDIYNSIINAESRSDKSMKSTQIVKTDLIASDSTAGTENTGASVGNYDLPEGASGIFELRKMPYVDIRNDETAVLFDETIKAYGGL